MKFTALGVAEIVFIPAQKLAHAPASVSGGAAAKRPIVTVRATRNAAAAYRPHAIRRFVAASTIAARALMKRTYGRAAVCRGIVGLQEHGMSGVLINRIGKAVGGFRGAAADRDNKRARKLAQCCQGGLPGEYGPPLTAVIPAKPSRYAIVAALPLAFLILSAHAVGPNNTLNDTGITQYGNASSSTLTSEPVDHPGQDARFGRDAKAAAGQLPKVGGGSAGFDFTALDANGLPTTPSSGATPHPCVRDNVTGLIWEVKTADGGLRDWNWTYTWYNNYVADVNATHLCGYTDWRMPTLKELESIQDYSRAYPNARIDPRYFPNTPTFNFWSGTSYALNSSGAWVIDKDGSMGDNDKSSSNHLRLVRAGN